MAATLAANFIVRCTSHIRTPQIETVLANSAFHPGAIFLSMASPMAMASSARRIAPAIGQTAALHLPIRKLKRFGNSWTTARQWKYGPDVRPYENGCYARGMRFSSQLEHL